MSAQETYTLKDLVDIVGDPDKTIRDGRNWVDRIRKEKGEHEFSALTSGNVMAIDTSSGRYLVASDPAEAAFLAASQFGKVPVFITPRFKRVAARHQREA